MQKTASYYDYMNLAIPWKPRVKASVKVLFALAVSINQLCYVVPMYLAMYVTKIMPDAVAIMVHSLVFGLTAGYSIRVARDVLRGYIRVRYLDPSRLSEQGPFMLAEGTGVHITITEMHEGVPHTSSEDTSQSPPKRKQAPEFLECELTEVKDGIPVFGPLNTRKKPAPLKQTSRLVISFFNRLCVFLFGSDGKHYAVELNRRQSSLIAFLATVARGTTATWKSIKDILYTGVTKASLYRDKSDIQKAVHQTAQQVKAEDTLLDLLVKREGTSCYSDLALSPACVIDEPAHLLFLYQQIQAILRDPDHAPSLDLEVLRSGYAYALQYEAGLFGQDLAEDLRMEPGYRVWTWAVPLYLEYRAKHLDLLDYAAERERKAGSEALDTLSQQECLKRALQLSQAFIVAGSRLYPDRKRCEEALRQVGELCEQLSDSAAADVIAQTYQDNVGRWERLNAGIRQR